MSLVMTLAMIVYVVIAYRVGRQILSFYVGQAQMEVLKAKEDYHKYLIQEDRVLTEKKALEEKFRELFLLYDMTKEIAKSFREEDALHVFRERLLQNVVFEDCQLIEPLAADIAKFKKDPNYIVFPLKGKTSLLGYIVIKGAQQEDQDKIMILANQFALILRRIYLYKEVERLAITDSLTQVFTRRYLMERFEEELNRARLHDMKLSYLMIDIDFFKKVNDQYGHLVGDSVLRDVAKKIQENIREIDIAGRYGGEEFCLVLPDTHEQGAAYVAERVRKAVESHTVKAYDATVKVTVSIGVATFPAHGKKMSTLIDKADWALYRAKKLGRNKICVFGMYEK